MNDRRLARHLVGLYLEDRPDTGGIDILVRSFPPSSSRPGLTPRQPIETLSAYISFARNRVHPVLSEEASNALVKAYVEMRNVGADPRTSDRRITATTRQLESMIRLSEAHARMRYSETVDVCSLSFVLDTVLTFVLRTTAGRCSRSQSTDSRSSQGVCCTLTFSGSLFIPPAQSAIADLCSA